jgi:hypothetical protein
MLSCDDAVPLIARAVDALLDQEDLDRLRAHLWQCGPCRLEVESHLSVKRLLAERPAEAPPPPGFGERLRGRLDREVRHASGHRRAERPPARGHASSEVNDGAIGWLELLNWRTWSIRLLPAAVALIAWAAMTAPTGRRAASIDLLSAVVAWTFPAATTTGLFVDPEVSDDALLLVLLFHGAGQPAREPPP